MVDVSTLDNWYSELRTQWEWIAGCDQFAALWDSEPFEIWHKQQSRSAQKSLLLIVKSVVANNAAGGVARIFDNDKGKDRICIPRFMRCLEDEQLANAYCRAPNGDLHLSAARVTWKTVQNTPSRKSVEERQSNQTLLIDAFREYRDSRQAHLLDLEPEGVFYADLWHLAREAGAIIEALGNASGTHTVSVEAVNQVWAERHLALFESWKS
ncbi:MAG: hypothetical protein OXH94_03030 [Rhodospirillales bacterium]|nr:hypothetical protein [Rhodospirillales bacterium]